MAVYAVGDLQGCAREFKALLKKLKLKDSDELWLAGDLVKRGPDSLEVLRKLCDMGEQTRIVLGNHDLHFLAIVFGGHRAGTKDTLGELLAADDVEDLAHWLRGQKLIHRDHGHVMVHAGLPPQWSVRKALALALEAESVIGQSESQARTAAISYRDFFANMYGNHPAEWHDELTGLDRLRGIVNYLTRMRLLDAEGALDFAHKGGLAEKPLALSPWFVDPRSQRKNHAVLFGHWASLNGETATPGCIALDTGCVWGRTLTAYCLDTQRKITQAAMVAD